VKTIAPAGGGGDEIDLPVEEDEIGHTDTDNGEEAVVEIGGVAVKATLRSRAAEPRLESVLPSRVEAAGEALPVAILGQSGAGSHQAPGVAQIVFEIVQQHEILRFDLASWRKFPRYEYTGC